MIAALSGRQPPQARSVLGATEKNARPPVDLDQLLFVLIDDRETEVDRGDGVRCDGLEEVVLQFGEGPLRLVDESDQGDRAEVQHGYLLKISTDALKPLSASVPGHDAHVVVVERGLRFLSQSRGQGNHPYCGLDPLDTAQKLLANNKAAREPDGDDAADSLDPSGPIYAFADDLNRNAHCWDADTILARAA